MVHEIKHDGYRIMVRLLSRNGRDWRGSFPAILEAGAALKMRSCLIDGEAVCCDKRARLIRPPAALGTAARAIPPRLRPAGSLTPHTRAESPQGAEGHSGELAAGLWARVTGCEHLEHGGDIVFRHA